MSQASLSSALKTRPHTIAAPDASDHELLEQLPLLDKYQVGHIRHIENLAHQLDNEWAHMGIRTSWQENFEALRYQLAYMSYAIALAHFNRLPNAPGYFRSTFDRLVQKMLLPDVWYYWRETSRGGGSANLEAPTSEGWIDPVWRDNIMFSAYIQSMSVLYHFLFDDDKYTQPGALTFKFNPILFRWDTRQDFVYDENSLNDHIYWRMVESGYLGIACEPYCVFQICNQPAILAFRLHDVLKGTSRAKEVTDGWLAAWSQFGHLDSEGRYNTFVRTHVNPNKVEPNVFGPWSDGWLGALLNMWNPELVKQQYPDGIKRWVVEYDDGTAYVPPAESEDIGAGSALDFGWCCMWASEVGDADMLGRFLAYADKYMNPTWEKGGYFYPRNDMLRDEQGRIVMMSPCAGNALIPYARLNVPDGLWNLYNKPWSREHFKEPLLNELSNNIDVFRARFLPEANKLVFSIAKRADRSGEAFVRIDNVWSEGRAGFQLTRDGAIVAKSNGTDVLATNIGATRKGNTLELRWQAGAADHFILSWS